MDVRTTNRACRHQKVCSSANPVMGRKLLTSGHSGITFRNSDQKAYVYVRWIQEGFTVEPPRNDSGANFQWNDSGFRPKVRVAVQKSELQTRSRSYSRADPKIRTESPRKGTRMGFRRFYHPNRNGCYFNFLEIVSASASVTLIPPSPQLDLQQIETTKACRQQDTTSASVM